MLLVSWQDWTFKLQKTDSVWVAKQTFMSDGELKTVNPTHDHIRRYKDNWLKRGGGYVDPDLIKVLELAITVHEGGNTPRHSRDSGKRRVQATIANMVRRQRPRDWKGADKS